MAVPFIEAFAELVEVVSEADVEAAAADALVDATGEEVIGDGAKLLTSTTEDGKIVLEPIFDADASTGSAEVLGPGDLGNLTKGQFHALWDNIKTFARWTGREIMKGALFQVGIEALETLLAKNPTPGVDNSDLKQIIGSVAASLKILTNVTTEWRRWCVRHFPNRNDYGMVNVEDTIISRFEIFRNNLGGFSVYMLKTLAPLLAQAHKDLDGANIGGLKAAMKEYADKILTQSKEVKQKESLMMHAGLQDHSDDVQKARDLLN